GGSAGVSIVRMRSKSGRPARKYLGIRRVGKSPSAPLAPNPRPLRERVVLASARTGRGGTKPPKASAIDGQSDRVRAGAPATTTRYAVPLSRKGRETRAKPERHKSISGQALRTGAGRR